MKTYYVYDNNNDNFEYIIEISELEGNEKFTLKYSSSTDWINPLGVIGSVVDTGDGFILSENFKNNLNYAEAEQLEILLKSSKALQKDKTSFYLLPKEQKIEI